VMSYLGWRTADELSLKELDEFLLARAMEHDSPSLLFRLASTAHPPEGPPPAPRLWLVTAFLPAPRLGG